MSHTSSADYFSSSQAVLPRQFAKLQKRSSILGANIGLVLLGSALLATLAQLSVPLSFTPVPVTGQTFAVYLLALLWGRKLATAAFLTYVLEGTAGLPVFAGATSGFPMGPTAGYFAGMLIACFVIGTFADRGWAKSWGRAIILCIVGSFCILGCGAIGLSFFLPSSHVLSAGVWPFLPGDLFKILLASSIVVGASRRT